MSSTDAAGPVVTRRPWPVRRFPVARKGLRPDGRPRLPAPASPRSWAGPSTSGTGWRGSSSEAREAGRRQATEDLDEATVAAKLGEEAARVLSTAHEAAAQIRARAEETSARLLRDAELEAARLRGDAEVEAARRRQEAEDQAEAEIEAAKAEGREMVAEARAMRERIFADLTRRRDLARQQIETLQAGRQQIMDALRGPAATWTPSSATWRRRPPRTRTTRSLDAARPARARRRCRRPRRRPCSCSARWTCRRRSSSATSAARTRPGPTRGDGAGRRARRGRVRRRARRRRRGADEPTELDELEDEGVDEDDDPAVVA